ncbi:MAG TPA: hypothetical protein VFN26_11650 [Candidatus Acidoferrum sp.]|nr:hypothetical protein [Candidatus Acidoferrum sp.]
MPARKRKRPTCVGATVNTIPASLRHRVRVLDGLGGYREELYDGATRRPCEVPNARPDAVRVILASPWGETDLLAWFDLWRPRADVPLCRTVHRRDGSISECEQIRGNDRALINPKHDRDRIKTLVGTAERIESIERAERVNEIPLWQLTANGRKHVDNAAKQKAYRQRKKRALRRFGADEIIRVWSIRHEQT